MVTLTLGINTGNSAQAVYLDGAKVPTAPNSGRMIFHYDVTPGVHKINTTDQYYDIEIYTGSDVNVASVYYRMINSILNPSKQSGIWFDTSLGYVKPTISIPVNSCWDGFLVSGPDGTNMVDLAGTLIGQGVTPEAHPTYFLVSSLTSAYNFSNNTIDYSHLLPSSCPIISKNVTVTGIDGQTISGRMSILDYTNFSSANINEGQFVVNMKGSLFLSNITDSTLPSNLTAVDALNFISAHNIPLIQQIITPANNAKQFQLFSSTGVQSPFILSYADYNQLLQNLVRPEGVANVVDVISNGPNTLQQALNFLNSNQTSSTTPPIPPSPVNNSEQFQLTAQNGNKVIFILLENDFQQLNSHLNINEKISNVVPIYSANPDTFVSVLSFLSNNTTATQVPPPPIPTPITNPPPNPVTNPPTTVPVQVTSGPSLSPIVVVIALAGAAGFALIMSSGKGKKKLTA